MWPLWQNCAHSVKDSGEVVLGRCPSQPKRSQLWGETEKHVSRRWPSAEHGHRWPLNFQGVVTFPRQHRAPKAALYTRDDARRSLSCILLVRKLMTRFGSWSPGLKHPACHMASAGLRDHSHITKIIEVFHHLRLWRLYMRNKLICVITSGQHGGLR